MAEAFVGEIRMFAGNFAPQGWAFCDGSLLPVDQNDALFAVLSKTFGGDGNTNFALPNLQSKVPVHWSSMGGNYSYGNSGGASQVTLNFTQLPAHTHPAAVTSQPASEDDPKPDGVFGAGVALTTRLYAPNTAPLNAVMHGSAIATAGNGGAHENRQPYLRVSFIMCLDGLYPQRP